MIAALSGELRQVEEDRVYLQAGAMLYEMFVPAIDVPTLEAAVGTELTFHTIFYLQGDASGGSIEPRLIAFLKATDKAFFNRFITVKGIGPRKALRALAVPVGEIARAIESKDVRFLVQLPEVGKRTAEQIVAELAGKVEEFALQHVHDEAAGSLANGRRLSADEDAIATLVALGERRSDAENLLERARHATPDLATTDALVREMLRMRTVRS